MLDREGTEGGDVRCRFFQHPGHLGEPILQLHDDPAKLRLHLIGAVLAEQNDEWAVSRKYMGRHSLARIYQSSTPEIEGDAVHAVAIPVH